MSKTTSTNAYYPTYTNSALGINGIPTASSTMSNGTLSTNYTMTDAQKAVYNYAQQALASILPQLNTLFPEVQNSMNSQINSYIQNGINDINNIYTPMITSLENDVASRFGNLDNSVFLDKLSGIESNRSNAINSFAQDILSKKNSLENDQLNRQYTYANLLDGLQNEYYNNALSALNLAINSSTSANNYNSNLYNSLYKQALANSSNNSIASSLANALGLYSTTSLGSF